MDIEGSFWPVGPTIGPEGPVFGPEGPSRPQGLELDARERVAFLVLDILQWCALVLEFTRF